MSSSDEANGSARPEALHNDYEGYRGLPIGSYTDQKLRHASAHHLHMTSRRFFIGPIPEGWVHGHRKSWYKSRLQFKNYTSQTLSFSVDPIKSHYTQRDKSQPDTQTDQAGPSSALAGEEEEEVALTFTHTNEESTEEEEIGEQQQQESAEEDSGELRTLPHVAAETGPDTETGTETETADDAPLGAPDDDDDEEDSDKTPRASARPTNRTEDDIYDNGEASTSFVTAREDASSTTDSNTSTSTIHATGLQPSQRPVSRGSQNLSVAGPSNPSPIISSVSAIASETDSTTHLLKAKPKVQKKLKSKASGISRFALEHHDPQSDDDDQDGDLPKNGYMPRRFTRKMAKYNINDNVQDKQDRIKSRIAKTGGTIVANRPRRRKIQDGEIIKAERMLVLVEETPKENLPADYSENDSLRMETRVADKWREFLVICRKGSAEHAPFSLQMYRTRVIPDISKPNSKTAPYYEVQLNHRNTHVNLYSSLDKTIVVWHPRKRGTKIYIIRPKSTAHAAEWYTFIRQVLGWRRPTKLPINVPDLGVSLVFNHPFDQLEARLGAVDDDTKHTTILSRTAAGERFAARAIIRGCLEMLEGRPEWSEVLRAWSKTEKMGLAWKRYDRLEWIFGENEANMCGTIAMQSSHELELRPRHHYSTSIRHSGEKETEPAPIEGFLIRLTSQKGIHQRMNKMFFKRLYFFTQDHYLLFCRPAKAFPPTPPKFAPTCMGEESDIPTSRQILNEMPISWDIDPYPVQDGDIVWLASGNDEFVQRHDEEAYAQLQRNVHNMSQADGYIDLCRVTNVRIIQRGTSPADPNVGEGPAVDFQPEPTDSRRDDGDTGEFDDDRTFEMVLDNDLVIRLQAYDAATRDEWVKRLDALVKYWRMRHADDAAELQAVRQRNLKLLEIDEEMESIVGQFAKKWEVKHAEASPLLHNMCALSGCRAIKMSGQLYRKPRRHSTFTKCHVILTAGKLLIFRSTLRKGNGVIVPHIHQQHETTIDLRDCYIYSGLITENDLLYANQTFDSNNPGLHALPRAYLSSDVYTSRDEDTAITFVLWQPIKKSFFRAQEPGIQGEAKHSLRHVTTLGKHGRTIVFKTRSRVEKDQWVLSISSEIDRLQEEKQEDIRIVSL
ncbi:hypothetical protein N7532_002059 [Penicillium argentinense]|uniref:PH domain-containing protein n=1 Tax=Penicillium argentinense TaxID=1131581 RepID=A0A9W9KLU6_9EURO|nr:uncharacterized protein N7532_002059 [Penicillium argentinense]KAJ5111524.1 hypothetical protein N7532_002059 [Penicillium argentinense]